METDASVVVEVDVVHGLERGEVQLVIRNIDFSLAASNLVGNLAFFKPGSNLAEIGISNKAEWKDSLK